MKPKVFCTALYQSSSVAAFQSTYSSSVIDARHPRNGIASGPTDEKAESNNFKSLLFTISFQVWTYDFILSSTVVSVLEEEQAVIRNAATWRKGDKN
ncbi:MAG: hypothetical protein WDO19_01795 [Bacteroidota bacterium]